MLTDDEIRKLQASGITFQAGVIRELCTRVLAAEAKLETLSAVSDERWARVDALARMVALEAERDAALARVKVLEDAGTALIADVKRRHPGEELHCQYMRALDEALQEQESK